MDTVIKSGQPAPAFSLPDMGGKLHTLDQYRGKIVVLNFWSAECPWAKRADELLTPMLAQWRDGVQLLSVASNASEKAERLRQEAAARGIAPLLHDADQKVARSYGALTTPHIFVIDAEGILRYQGAFDDANFRQPEPTRNYLFEAVEALLAGERPDPAKNPSYGCTVVYHRPGS
jgi:peroxiredoxin